jgi:N6-L-threonylcarbamoyladenine synthase
MWNIPIIPVNHMEGHLIASAVATTDAGKHYAIQDIPFPVLGLLISGGHTEFVYAKEWGAYACIGATRDDSVGEAFDKVARLLGLPYPGGPEVSRLAEKGRPMLQKREITPLLAGKKSLPRPMIHSENLDFSFSGLKTAVKYMVRDIPEMTDELRNRICAEFEDAVAEVFIAKATRALAIHPTRTFLIGGGVSANAYIRTRIADFVAKQTDGLMLCLPAQGLSTDNAIMIGMAGYMRHLRGVPAVHGSDSLSAMGNMTLS